MKTDATTDTTPQTVSTSAPKEPKTATITLTAATGQILTLRAHRLRVGAESFVTTTEGKTTTRGMTVSHATFEIAKAAIAAQAVQAEKLGWTRKQQGRGFVAAPDAFSELPKAPKAAPKATPAPKVVKK